MSFFSSSPPPMAIPNSEVRRQQEIRDKLIRGAALLSGAIAIVAAASNMDRVINAISKGKDVTHALIVESREIMGTIVDVSKNRTVYKQQAVEQDTTSFHQASALYTPHPYVEHIFLQDRNVQEHISQVIASTYRISNQQAQDIVTATVVHSQRYSIDPLLLLGLMAQESSFNTRAQSSYGAQGLTQVVPRWHMDSMQRLGVNNILTAPIEKQVELGTRVLHNFMQRTSTVELGLQHYNRGPNASPDPSWRYASGVLDYRTMFKREIQTYLTTQAVGYETTKPESGPQA